MALGVLRALHEADIPVPALVSVVGFDDMPEAAQFWPPLTSVHQEFEEVGRAAVDVLLARIDDVDAVHRLLVPTRLVVRGSTSTAPRKATS